jgi:valine--pyruvate aminotransferase
MDDLGRALAEPHEELFMLGGGNPALIPEVCTVWRERLQAMLDRGEAIDRMLAVYDPPQGNGRFVKAIASVLERHLGRGIPLEQIAVTAGGQSAFFALFNLLAGPSADGHTRQIVLPIAPEYIGYRDQGFPEGIFRAFRPKLIERGGHDFRYAIAWDRLEITQETAAICVSSPTNPSGNLLEGEDLAKLAHLAASHGIPLIIDNAYGLPFPQILFRPARMLDAPNVVHVFSLSKVGLPGVRNAVVLAPEAIARRVTSVVAVTGLANPTIGQAIVTPMLENGELEKLSCEVIAPFYQRKLELARSAFAEAMHGLDYALHEAGGAMFLWAGSRASGSPRASSTNG